jgi:hypothetical protein
VGAVGLVVSGEHKHKPKAQQSKAKEMAAISFKEYSVPCLVLYLQHQSHSLLILIILDSAKKQDFDEADCARRPVCG